MEQQFKVGSVYRQQNGAIVRLLPWAANADWALTERVDTEAGWCDGGGARRLDNGKYVHDFSNEGVALLPGELHQINGEWVKVEDKPAKSLGALIREQQAAKNNSSCAKRPSDENAAMIARDGPARVAIPKPQQLTVLVKSTAKPALAALTRLGDTSSPLHGSAMLKKV